MNGAAPLPLEILMDQSRFTDLLSPGPWRQVTREFGESYTIRTLYEGALGGLAEARLISLVAGRSDAEVRIVIDAVPAIMSRAVLVASRATVRVLAARTRDRLRMLERMALLLHLVEPVDSVPDVRPLPVVRGLSGALSLAQSPAQPAIWSALYESMRDFGPTVALDLRDGGGAIEGRDLSLVLHSPSVPWIEPGLESRRVVPGGTAAEALAAEVRARDQELFVATPAERRRAGLTLTSGELLMQTELSDPPLAQAAAATAACGSLGVTALGLGVDEAGRALALTTAAAATIVQALQGFGGVIS